MEKLRALDMVDGGAGTAESRMERLKDTRWIDIGIVLPCGEEVQIDIPHQELPPRGRRVSSRLSYVCRSGERYTSFGTTSD